MVEHGPHARTKRTRDAFIGHDIGRIFPQPGGAKQQGDRGGMLDRDAGVALVTHLPIAAGEQQSVAADGHRLDPVRIDLMRATHVKAGVDDCMKHDAAWIRLVGVVEVVPSRYLVHRPSRKRLAPRPMPSPTRAAPQSSAPPLRSRAAPKVPRTGRFARHCRHRHSSRRWPGFRPNLPTGWLRSQAHWQFGPAISLVVLRARRRRAEHADVAVMLPPARIVAGRNAIADAAGNFDAQDQRVKNRGA